MMTKVKQGGCYGCYVSSLGLTATVVVAVFLLLQPTATNAVVPKTHPPVRTTPSYMIPTTTLEKFTIFALKEKPINNTSSRNNTIHYQIRLHNSIATVPYYYDTLNLTFYYKPNSIDKQRIGNATFKGFYQSTRSSKALKGNFEAKGVRWENITASPVIFRVELVTMTRHDTTYFTKSKWRRYEVGANFKVDDQGNFIEKKYGLSTELRSRVGRNFTGSIQLMGLFSLFLFYFW